MLFKNLLILFCLVCLLGAENISSTTLIENAKALNARQVTYQGEAVGDLMIRGNNAWLNINDDSNAIGVWGKKELFKPVSTIGGYFQHGDIVLVEGIFHRACQEHGGDLDIHATKVVLVKKGYPLHYPLGKKTLWLAGFWSGLAILLLYLNFYLKKK